MTAKLKTGLMFPLAVILFGLIGFILSSAWPKLFPELQRLEPDSNCDLHSGGCERLLPGGASLRFSIAPAEIPLMADLTLSVAVQGAEVSGVQVDIKGLNMEMGINRTRLQPQGEGRWLGKTLLPVCSNQVMEWEASVWLESQDGGKPLSIPHRFETRRAR